MRLNHQHGSLQNSPLSGATTDRGPAERLQNLPPRSPPTALSAIKRASENTDSNSNQSPAIRRERTTCARRRASHFNYVSLFCMCCSLLLIIPVVRLINGQTTTGAGEVKGAPTGSAVNAHAKADAANCHGSGRDQKLSQQQQSLVQMSEPNKVGVINSKVAARPSDGNHNYELESAHRRRHRHHQRENPASSAGSSDDATALTEQSDNRRPTGRAQLTRPVAINDPASSTCEGCLGPASGAPVLAPLAALRSFIIPPSRASDRRATTKASTGGNRPYGRDRASAYAQQLYQYQRAAQGELRPQSDEKCPMTGPLTICDQVVDYPFEAILARLDNAKRLLRRSSFNLDSLFSDEREHSSEPFDEPPMEEEEQEGGAGMRHPGPIGSAVKPSSYGNNNFSPPTNGTTAANYHRQHRDDYASPNYGSQWGAYFADYHAVLGTGPASEGGGANLELVDDPVDADKPAAAGERPVNNNMVGGARGGPRANDEFVNIVERRAISLPKVSPSASQPGRRELPEVAGRPDDATDQYRTNRFPPTGPPIRSQAASGQHHRQQQPQQQQPLLMVSSKALADGLLSMGESLSQYGEHGPAPVGTAAAAAAKRGPSYQSYQVALSMAASSPSNAIVGANSSLSSTLVAAVATPDKMATSERQESVLKARGQARKRPRRQVADEPGEAGLGGTTPATGRSLNSNSNSNLDPERISDAANGVGEPICRAKSIYISPRAALNDKKQWKYVVNAPERDPQVRQIIRVDICEDPLGPCSDQVSLPFGFTSQCKQKYSKKKLLALDSQSGLLEVDTFFIPSCCVCQLVRERQPLDEDSSLAGDGNNNNSEANDGSTAPNLESDAPGERRRPQEEAARAPGNGVVLAPTTGSNATAQRSRQQPNGGLVGNR